jgi:hypothetical protein
LASLDGVSFGSDRDEADDFPPVGFAADFDGMSANLTVRAWGLRG